MTDTPRPVDRSTGEALTFPAWVNYGAAERESLERRARLFSDMERVATRQDIQEATVEVEDPSRRHRFDAHAPGYAEPGDPVTTGTMLTPLEARGRHREEYRPTNTDLLTEDWVDRFHRGEGRPLGPALIALAAIAAYCLLAMAVVWFGASWLAHLLT